MMLQFIEQNMKKPGSWQRAASAFHARSTTGIDVLRQSLVMTVALALVTIPGVAAATEDEETSLDVAEIFFELNNTDGDLGIHALIDGEAWQTLEIESPEEDQLLWASMR